MKNNGTDNGGMNALMAGAMGVLAGALAVILYDKNNRTKIKESVNNLLEKGDQKLDEVQQTVEELKTTGKRKLAKQLDKTKHKIDESLKETEDEMEI